MHKPDTSWTAGTPCLAHFLGLATLGAALLAGDGQTTAHAAEPAPHSAAGPDASEEIARIRQEIAHAYSRADCNRLEWRIEELASRHGHDRQDQMADLRGKLKVARQRITHRYDAQLEAIRTRRFELARRKAEGLPARIEPLLRAGRFAEAAALARSAAEPFRGTDQPEAFFEPWWTCAELMGALQHKVIGAIAAGRLPCPVSLPIGEGKATQDNTPASFSRTGDIATTSSVAWNEAPPKVLCEWAAAVADPEVNDRVVALGLFYLYRAGDLEKAAECFQQVERRGGDCSWYLATLARVRESKKRPPAS